MQQLILLLILLCATFKDYVNRLDGTKFEILPSNYLISIQIPHVVPSFQKIGEQFEKQIVISVIHHVWIRHLILIIKK